MEKSVLILGNGFDLHNHFRTSYIQFYQCLNLIELNKNSFDDFYKEYISLGNKPSEEPIVNNKDGLKGLFGYYIRNNDNFFIQYFTKIIKDGLEKWVYVEDEIKKILTTFDDFFAKTEMRIDSIDFTYKFKIDKDNKMLLLILDEVKQCKLYKLDNETISFATTKQIENITYEAAKKAEMRDETKETFVSNFAFSLYNELTIFEKVFEKYLLASIINDVPFDPKYFSKFGIADCRKDDILIITYNYTRYIESIFKNSTYKYIHGFYSIANEKNHIIFGIDSNCFFENYNDSFSIFTKEERRIKNKTMYLKIEQELKDIKNLIIFGHSLSAEDDDSLKLIFDKCVELFDANNWQDNKIVVYYRDSNEQSKLMHNVKRIIGTRYAKLANNELITYEKIY